jgi:hypothetical protein
MNLAYIFQPKIFMFGMTICGYGAIFFLVKEAERYQLVTIPCRAFILLTRDEFWHAIVSIDSDYSKNFKNKLFCRIKKLTIIVTKANTSKF